MMQLLLLKMNALKCQLQAQAERCSILRQTV